MFMFYVSLSPILHLFPIWQAPLCFLKSKNHCTKMNNIKKLLTFYYFFEMKNLYGVKRQ